MKLFLNSIFIFFSIFSIYQIETSYIYNPVFKIKEISFLGQFSLVKNEASKLATELYEKNIWEVDTDLLEKQLKKDIRIEEVDVEFSEIGKINIKINQKKPEYYVKIQEEIYSIDSKGKIYSFINEDKIKELPVIFIENENEIAEVIKILTKIKDENLLQMISQIYYENSKEVNFSISGNTVIKTNEEVLTEKYNVLRELFINLSKNKKIEYIDLRFDGYVVKSTGDDKDGKK
ncbi:MAG: cell division protein FtsQ/DivIB [Fusobacteriaceae bacterium]